MAMELGSDLAQLSTDGARLQLLHRNTSIPLETEDGEAVVLIVAGQDGEQYRKAKLKIERRQLEDAKRSRSYRLTPEQIESNTLDILVACTVGWENCAYKGDEEFSADVIRGFYKSERWAAEQVEEFMNERANFSAASKTI